MCVPFRSRDFWPKAINSKEYIKRSLGDNGVDQKTFQALPISWQYLYDYTCSCMLQTKVFCYYSWNTSLQLISCLTCFFLFKCTVFVLLKGSRVYPVRIQGTESVATIDWLFLPQKARRCPGTRIYFGTSPRPARINLISFLGGPSPCKATLQSTCTILEQNYSNTRFIWLLAPSGALILMMC